LENPQALYVKRNDGEADFGLAESTV